MQMFALAAYNTFAFPVFSNIDATYQLLWLLSTIVLSICLSIPSSVTLGTVLKLLDRTRYHSIFRSTEMLYGACNFVFIPYGTEWPSLCWCAVKKLLTHSLVPPGRCNLGVRSPEPQVRICSIASRGQNCLIDVWLLTAMLPSAEPFSFSIWRKYGAKFAALVSPNSSVSS